MPAAVVCLGVLAAAVPWVLVLRRRVGAVAAIAIVTLAVPALVLTLMFVGHATGLPLDVGVIGLIFAVLAAGWTVAVRSGGLRGLGALWRRAWPASVGAGIALGTFALAVALPGASRLAWAMLGDSASQLVEARFMLAVGGIAPPPLNNPVPLTPALVAAVAAPGRPASGAGEILAHDLMAYATTWAMLIVASCALAGLVAHAVVTKSIGLSGVGARLTVATTSLLPLGWFWTGYPVKFGFINAHVVYVLLLAAIAAYLALIRKPWLGTVLQALATVLVIVTWSPLAIVPAGLALVHGLAAVRSWGALARGMRISGIAVACLAVALGLVLGVPMLLDARGSLNIAGGLAEFPKPMLPLAVGVLIALVLISPTRFTRAGWGLVSVGASTLAGLALVLVLSGQITGPWSYYPHKYAWLATAVVLTLVLPLACCFVATWKSAPMRIAGYSVGVFAVAVSLGLGSWWAPGEGRLLGNSVPVLILVEDDLPDAGQPPDVIVDAIVTRVEQERLTIPWRSSLANDYRASFWLIQLEREKARERDDGVAAVRLWHLANFHEEPEDLCNLAEIVPQGLTIETRSDDLESRLLGICPHADIVVEVGGILR